MNIIEALNWRYATKHFDQNKKLSKQQLDLLLQSINLTASSYGLQPYKVISIEDDALKTKLQEASYNQPQLTEASNIIIFAAETNITPHLVDTFIQRIVQTRNVSIESLKDYETKMKGSIKNKSQEDLFIWASKQCYIGLGQLLTTCAIEKIDACPMEGFDKEAFDKILDLDKLGLSTVVIATVGFRASDDQYQHLKKVRKELNELLITL